MTEFALTLEERENVLVARVEGEVDFTNVDEIERRILAAANNDLIAIALDLTRTGYVDSAGVRMIFTMARHLDACRQRLGLVAGSASPLRRLIDFTNLGSVASLCETVEACLDQVRSDAVDPR